MSTRVRCRPLRHARAHARKAKSPCTRSASASTSTTSYPASPPSPAWPTASPRAARRNAAVRVLTLDLAPAQTLLLADLAKRAGFGSFYLRRRAPLRSSPMADASYITVTTYLRFEFTPSFVRRPYLIYVDADVLVRGDVSEPLGSLAPDETGAVRDEFNPAKNRRVPGAAERWPHLRGRPYFNAGVLWTHTDHMPRIRRGVEQALIHARRHILHNDQDALTLVMREIKHPEASRTGPFG
ncbi:glycosyltransferase [Streptomyces sp. NPDC001933]|uniref:glycosyltransferase n=1 Tax=Streptomyces sp. NPDC001933 TaxID=3364626 RepID=UPI003674E805